MPSGRLEAFTDGVVAIIITIMVLELKVPDGGSLASLRGSVPLLLAYAGSFVNVGLYWNNHHHLFHATDKDRRAGAVVKPVPAVLAQPGAICHSLARRQRFFGGCDRCIWHDIGMVAVAYSMTVQAIIACNGADSTVARAIGSDRKGRLSMLPYAAAVPLAFVSRWLALALYLAVILMWLVPDRRLARELQR
jgi:uncharacterized membrane protein